MRPTTPASKRPQAVIFDLGRVLVQVDLSRGLWARILRELDHPAADPARRRNWLEVYQRFSTGRLGAREFHLQFVELSGWSLSFDEFAWAWCDVFTPMPGMEALLGWVRRQAPVGLLSDTDPLHWTRILEQFPWVRQIPRPTLSHEVGALKPAAEAYLAATRNTGHTPAACLFIDDLEGNVAGARAIGMPAVLFRGAAALRRDLEDRGFWVAAGLRAARRPDKV